jgi:hypothetical protein
MGLKEFFRPDKWKVGLTILFLIGAFLFGFGYMITTPDFLGLFFIALTLIFTFPFLLMTQISGNFGVILVIPWCYILACSFVEVVKRYQFNGFIAVTVFWAVIVIASLMFAFMTYEPMNQMGPQQAINTCKGYCQMLQQSVETMDFDQAIVTGSTFCTRSNVVKNMGNVTCTELLDTSPCSLTWKDGTKTVADCS